MISDRILFGYVLQGPGHDYQDGGHPAGSHNDSTFSPTQAQPNYFQTPNFSEEDRYNPEASYNLAPSYTFPKALGLPIAKNFDYETFIKTTWGNNTETNQTGDDLPLYINLPNLSSEDSFQWDSFPAGEAQQFLTFSVDRDTINDTDLYNGENGGETPVILDALSSSKTQRPFTISLSVTPYNAGPIPHIHWAEDEWFVVLQGEMDSWIGDPFAEPYELNEFPAGSEPSDEYYSGQVLTEKNVENFYYGHLTPGQSVYLPRGHAHAYRNASPSGDPLVFLTIWSRSPGYPEGGIEQFFTLPDPRIGYFFDTSNDAASFGNLNNKNIGSEIGIENQQRFVDYFNTFPDYHVAMSRNYGSFASSDSAGGNWNPAIANDTAAISAPPPSYWSKDSDTPWFTDASDEDASPFYVPPAPNAPSDKVKFATPFDPSVVQIAQYAYTGSSKKKAINAFENDINQLQNIIASSDGIASSYLLSDPTNTSILPSYTIQTTYQTYSDLSALQESADFVGLTNTILKNSDLNVVNNTVNADVRAENGQVLVGVAKVKPGSIDDAVQLSSSFVDSVNENSLSLDSAFYVDVNQPNTLVFLETYESGKQVNEYLTSTEYNEFASQFGPLLKTGQLASRDVSIYPVNSNISQFYPEQLAGMNLLTEILESMPNLQLSLQLRDGFLIPSNTTDTSDVGGFLSVRARPSSSTDLTYGYLKSGSAKPQILFEQFDGMRGKKFIKNTNHRLVPFTSGDRLQFFSSTQSAIDISENGLTDGSFTYLDSADLKNGKKTAKYEGLNVTLESPVQGLSEVSSSIQKSLPGIVDLTQVPRRTLYGEFHILDSSGNHLHDNEVGYGLYQVANKKGSVTDPVTGKNISPSKTNKFAAVMSALELDGELASANPMDHKSYSVEGGFQYSPYLKIDEVFYTPYNSDFYQLGENAFAFQATDNIYSMVLDVHKSGNLQLLA